MRYLLDLKNLANLALTTTTTYDDRLYGLGFIAAIDILVSKIN